MDEELLMVWIRSEMFCIEAVRIGTSQNQVCFSFRCVLGRLCEASDNDRHSTRSRE